MWRKRIEIKDEKDRVIKDYEKSKQMTMNRAVRLLAAKPRSVEELRQRLFEKEWTNSAIIEEILEKLKEYNYLNDEQFAKSLASSKLRQKPLGKRRLKQTLSQKKLDKETVEQAIENVYENTPEDEVIEIAIKKRLRIKGKPETREDSKKFYDYLMRQGFSYDLISSKMREIGRFEDEINE
ncbi:MAG: regulatory protein RecX [Pyrinomonadaceae bacterium]